MLQNVSLKNNNDTCRLQRYSTFFASLLMSCLPWWYACRAFSNSNTKYTNDAIGVYSLFSRDVKSSEINNICSSYSYPNIMKIRYNICLITWTEFLARQLPFLREHPQEFPFEYTPYAACKMFISFPHPHSIVNRLSSHASFVNAELRKLSGYLIFQ